MGEAFCLEKAVMYREKTPVITAGYGEKAQGTVSLS